MIDYAREYGIDVERLRLEHPAQVGQVRVARAHEVKARDKRTRIMSDDE